MRTLIKVSVVLLIGLAGIGFYRGWFNLSSSKPDTEGDKVTVSVLVDKGKIKSDVKQVEGEVKEEIKDIEGKIMSKDEKK